jgi:hypothetical protein
MRERWTQLIGKVRQIESAIQSRIEGPTRSPAPGSRQPLEIVHAIVRAVEREIEPAGRGRAAFPYTHVRVWIAAPSPRDRARLEVACDGPPSLAGRIAERVSGARPEGAPLHVKMTFVTKGRDDWMDSAFHVEYGRTTLAVVPPPGRDRLELAVLRGTAERPSYSFPAGTVAIGRGADVRDAHGRLIRTNHVAFVEDASDVNVTVSRRHARIEHDAASGAFRLHDDGASQGTSVVRAGRNVPVTRVRGLRLKTGDVIVLGQARLRVRVATASS